MIFMFVINPEKYSVPAYRIGPFRTQDIAFNNKLPVDSSIDLYFKERFKDRKFYYFINGRSALNKALDFYNLRMNDVVTILTTTGNVYIAKCVTDEIQKICQWSRNLEKNTKVIFVNHEFGYPYPEIEKLKDLKLPIIEDCAGSFFSKDKRDTIGKVGDFVIYSFPKMFPIQIGGLLVSNIATEFKDEFIDPISLQYIKNVLSHYIKSKDLIIKKRIQNYKKNRNHLKTLGFDERFKLEEGIVPGVFMFRKGKVNVDLAKLKEYMWAHGIQCSLLYQEETFFIPTHQCLNKTDLEYFKEVISSNLKQNDILK